MALGPDVAGTQYLYVFWQGADNNLWSQTVKAAGVGTATITVSSVNAAPVVVPGMGPLGSKPSATYVSAGFGVPSGATAGLGVFWKGSDGNLWWVNIPVTAATGVVGAFPTGPSVIGGMAVLGSEPTASSDAAGNVYVFWQGSGNNTRVWEAWHGSGSTSWSSTPNDLGAWSGNTGSAPTAAVSPTGTQFVFWQGQDSNLWYEWYNGAAWQGPVSVGDGPMNSKPAVAFSSGGGIAVFWKGTDLNIWTTSNTVNGTGTTGVTGAWATVKSIGYGPLDGV